VNAAEARMVAEESTIPLRPGDSAPQFELPRADQEGTVSLDDYRGQPLLLTLMRGVRVRSADGISPCWVESRPRSGQSALRRSRSSAPRRSVPVSISATDQPRSLSPPIQI